MAQRGVNKSIILGRVGKDPEVRYAPSGDAIANLTIATSEVWKDKQTGEKKEKTEWHRVTAFRKLAEIIGQHVKKGQQVYIEGRLETKKWQHTDGSDRYTTSIIANELQMLGGGNGASSDNKNTAGTQGTQGQPQPSQSGGNDAPFDDDIQF